MTKWQNGKGPALWPIDMTQISRVDFVAIPKTDVDSFLTEIALRRQNSDIPECPTHLKTDTVIGELINVLCKRLRRQTQITTECFKGSNINTDVLRSALEQVILDINPSDSKQKNSWGLSYDFLTHSHIDIKYETIFGDTKVIITSDSIENPSTVTVETKCEQCLVIRDDNGSIVGFDKNELENIEMQNGPFNCFVDSVMVYSLCTTFNGEVIRATKITVRRPLEFIFGIEYLILTKTSSTQDGLQKRPQTLYPFYLNGARYSVGGTQGYLILGNIKLCLGSAQQCKANIVKPFFNRANSNPYKTICLDDIHLALSRISNQKHGANSRQFTERVSAARIKLNTDITSMFETKGEEVFLQENKQIFINKKFLLPLKRKD